ncbi:MAG: hypothetical protein MZV64_31170 [Ignavibacteriales bacterium]|nr:hypothetical protein [Ignavibacteriales bacterium]
MKIILCIASISFALIFAISINAQTTKTGTTATQVLKFNVGPRAIGMGGAFTAVSDDITAMYWNPAVEQQTSYLTKHFLIIHALYADVRHDFAAYATNLSRFRNSWCICIMYFLWMKWL